MITDPSFALDYCLGLHEHLMEAIADRKSVRKRVEKLIALNSFKESCFCKGCVLPIVDSWTTTFLADRYNVPSHEVLASLRCEGYETPLYSLGAGQVGFSSYSRSNSYHPGDKSGRRRESRRSPDFCVRHKHLRVVGEMKYVPVATRTTVMQVLRELKDYLSIASETTSDWGHDFGYGLAYAYSGETPAKCDFIVDQLECEKIAISWFH